jgi:hypothetical protein
MSTLEVGELLYEYTLKITGVTDYGISLEALMTRRVAIPPAGARFDVAVTGNSPGPRLMGKIAGVDYLWVRADGRFQIHVHAEIATDDGARIALHADGVARPRAGSAIIDLRENVTLFTSAPGYSWVNALQVWATGTVDIASGAIQVSGWSA